MKYSFQSLLERNKDGEVTGPMSPVTSMQIISREQQFNVNGLIRLQNHQAPDHSYDHLITKSIYPNASVYRFFADMGHAVCPISLYVKGEVPIITPIYKKEILNMIEHRRNVELKGSNKDNPIMVLNEDDMIEIIKQAEEQDKFKIKEYVSNNNEEQVSD